MDPTSTLNPLTHYIMAYMILQHQQQQQLQQQHQHQHQHQQLQHQHQPIQPQPQLAQAQPSHQQQSQQQQLNNEIRRSHQNHQAPQQQLHLRSLLQQLEKQRQEQHPFAPNFTSHQSHHNQSSPHQQQSHPNSHLSQLEKLCQEQTAQLPQQQRQQRQKQQQQHQLQQQAAQLPTQQLKQEQQEQAQTLQAQRELPPKRLQLCHQSAPPKSEAGSTEPDEEEISRHTSNEAAKEGDEKSTPDLISSAAQAINTTLAKAPPELVAQQPAWVFCTRYSDRPSSGPRTRRAKTQKDKKAKDPKASVDEKRPRTAFTSEQLEKLRQEFEANSYLDERRRKDLAERLCLNENQIKIWFQNKRAKMKKQNNQPNPLRGLLVAGGLYNHSTATSDCSESPEVMIE